MHAQTMPAGSRPFTRTVRRWPDAARLAGAAYLGLAVCGLLGNVVVHGAVYDADDATTTVSNLVDHEALARLGIVLDLGVVLMQAVAAWGLFVVFRRVHATAAGAIAVFGLGGAAGLLVAATGSTAALDAALERGQASAGDVQLLGDLQAAAWQVAGLFFGLWLVPMGIAVLRSGRMPRLLGWLLVVGGGGYVLHPFVATALSGLGAVDALLIPSTIGEVWMIGHLLVRGGPASVADRPVAAAGGV